MANWYVTREAFKAASLIEGSGANASIDRVLEGVSADFDAATSTFFVPRTETRKYDARWPALDRSTLELRQWLQSVTTIKDRGGDRTHSNADFRLMPDIGPPYDRIQNLIEASVNWESDPDKPGQDDIEITGEWGAHSETEAAGALDGALSDTTGTTLVASRGDLIEVGHTLLIDSERFTVTERTDADLAVDTSGALTASVTDKTITFDGAPTLPLFVGEVIRVGSEAMTIEAINSTSSFEVGREADGTTLAAHSDNSDVFVRRTYTVVRGVNGSTAATHTDTTAISRYRAPRDVERAVLAMAQMDYQQGRSSWGRTIGRGDAEAEITGTAVHRIWMQTVNRHRMYQLAGV